MNRMAVDYSDSGKTYDDNFGSNGNIGHSINDNYNSNNNMISQPFVGLSVNVDETGAQFFRRIESKPFKSGIPFIDLLSKGGIQLGDVLEIHGSSGSGKTELSLSLISKYVLSKKVGGFEQKAVIFDHENRFDPIRLYTILVDSIMFYHKHISSFIADNEAESQARDCLKRVQVIRCFNNLELLASLELLYEEIKYSDGTLILIDSLGSFFFKDKMIEMYSGPQTVLQAGIWKSFARIISTRSVIVVATKPHLYEYSYKQATVGYENKFAKEYLPQSWQSLVKMKVALSVKIINNYPRYTARIKLSSNSGQQQQSSRPAENLFSFEISDMGICSVREIEERFMH